MARSATSEIRLNFTSKIQNTMTDGQVASLTVGKQIISGELATGISASQANRAWEDRGRVITSGNSEDIDLYDLGSLDIGAGAGKDGLGQDWIAEEIVTIIISQTAGDGRLEVMPSNPTGYLTWMPSLTVANGGALRSGGVLMLHNNNTDAFDISDGVSHVIRLKANGGSVTYDIYVLARHDDDESSSSSSSSLSSSSSCSSASTSSSSSSVSTSSSSFSSSSQSSQSTSSQSTSCSSESSSTT